MRYRGKDSNLKKIEAGKSQRDECTECRRSQSADASGCVLRVSFANRMPWQRQQILRYLLLFSRVELGEGVEAGIVNMNLILRKHQPNHYKSSV